MAREGCDACAGSRHVRAPGGWRPCDCLSRDRARRLYREAGVPRRFEQGSWRDLLASWRPSNARALVLAASDLRAGRPGEAWLLLSGRPAAGKEFAAALLLRAACDGRLGARAVDLPQLVDHEFRRDGTPTVDPYKLDLLVVSAGAEPAHRYNKHVLERALRVRWEARLPTVLVSHVDPTRLGALYRSSRVEEAVAERFTRVALVPKGE